MTFRAKPVTTRQSRPSRDGQSRRNLYLNIGFGLAVAIAVAILVGVAVISWYSDHLAGRHGRRPDDHEGRVPGRRPDRGLEAPAADRPGRCRGCGGPPDKRGSQFPEDDDQSQGQGDQIVQTVLERLIDAKIQAGLATENGITVTPAQIDEKVVEESTTPKSRHAWVIAVEPAVDSGKTDPTDAQKAAAKTIADQALVDVTTGGKKWEDVAKAVSTDVSKSTGGDLGWLDKTSTEDKAFVDALFAAEQGKPTAVVL